MADITNTKSIKGSQTEKLLALAYVAESTAYTRYTFYAQQAEKESYYPVAQIFNDTAANELHHGKVFFKLLEGGTVNVSTDIDAGVIADTASNLACAAEEERVEGVDLYRHAAEVAREEGFDEIATHFETIAAVEERHRRRFLAYLKQVKDGTIWHRDHPIKWQCLVCGYVFEGVEPPKVCPGCSHPYQHYIALDMDEL